MSEKLKNFLSGLSALPAPQKILMIGMIGSAVAGVFILIVSLQKPSYVLLYSGLSTEDASEVVQELKKEKVLYKLGADGGSVLVPADKVYEARMSMASKGLPRSGIGFEIFDKVNIGTTEFVQKMNYQRAMQGELARTISELDGVERCRVHISIPDKTVFIEDQEAPTASVILKLRPGFRVHPKRVRGIAYLVAGAVEGLSPEKVTIMDTEGRVLNGGQEDTAQAGLSSTQMEYQRNLEKTLAKNIESLLEKVIGIGKIKARVSATLNFKQVRKTEELYDPNVTAVRSEQTSKEKSTGRNGAPSGIPGVASNVPGQSGTVVSKTNTYQKQNDTVNYEINKVTRQVVEPVGSIQRLSVAVLVDGSYKSKEGSDKKEYVPRTDQELKKYETLIKGVIGFDEKRGDQIHVENIPFEQDVNESWAGTGESKGLISPLMIVILRYAVIALVGVLFLLFFVRPLMTWITSTPGTGYPATVAELETALDKHMLPGLNRDRQQELREDLQKLLKEEPALATTLVRDWLNDRR